ncbi:hypothetical protein HPP92_019352 [Vanilla planifolia]|uniref:Protein kinase domain-containing protein n=1 Tax=Vanilla planifolia TaxID=51239 RepID=A0A835UJ34_VANPL|nr:hypothetical protein HPP92_019352 [Vanilla planifolia]
MLSKKHVLYSQNGRGKGVRRENIETASEEDSQHYKNAKAFRFDELMAATNNFSNDCFIGEGGFGKVYKGRLQGTDQIVAIKQLNLEGEQGNREFYVEILMLSLLHHPNLVTLIGYCADGAQRLVVYEYVPLGSLADHLHDVTPNKMPLDWRLRIEIALGAAKGLEYLHDIANPAVIYRDLKSSNILLGEDYQPKLSDFGLARLAPEDEDGSHVTTTVMGTYGYCAPEYIMTGRVNSKSDIFSFGVLLLELITGRKAFDNTRVPAERSLVEWVRPFMRERTSCHRLADPLLQGHYPKRGVQQLFSLAGLCINEKPSMRPVIADVVTALSHVPITYGEGSSSSVSPGVHQSSRNRT